MNPVDNSQPVDEVQRSGTVKKPYRRPSVQVYGTLSQITQTNNNPAASALDPGATPTSPNGQKQTNRT
jgi:hypothetical protein